MTQPPKTDLARELWETCPHCYGQLIPDRDGALLCPKGHYRAENATMPPDDFQTVRAAIADGGETAGVVRE